MKKNNIIIITLIAALAIISSCSESFLEIKPKGVLDQGVLATEKGVDMLLIGAYSLLDGVSSQFGWESASSNWVYGDIRGMVGNKGTDSGDQPDINPIQTFSETATNPYLNVKWRQVYEGVSRANSAILVAAQALADGAITQEKHDEYVAQAKALRGWYHFEAWRMWEKVPYVDETTDLLNVTNADDPRDKIIADLQAGIALPENMGQVGRFNKTVCQVLTAKALMQMKKDYAGALTLLNAAKTGKKPNGAAIGLAPTYGEIFDIVNRNGIEAVYTVQYSVNDGSGGYNGGWGEVLNFPYKGGGSPGGCCGFFQATQEFVNSFRTSGGLPLPNYTYNSPAEQNLRDQGIPAGNLWVDTVGYSKDATVTRRDPAQPFIDRAYKSLTGTTNWTARNRGNDPLVSAANWQLLWVEDNSKEVDPRLDWTIGRRGIPYWDWGVHTGADWVRDQSYAGPYSPKKQVYKKSQEGQYTEVGNWTSGWTANGYRMIRYADILLLAAECEIEAPGGSLANATALINQVRTRAANAAGFVKEADGTTNAANYVISNYPAPFATKAAAQYALSMERKLELGMEGHRYFDLNRWGTTVAEITRVLAYEKTMAWGNSMYGTNTFGAEDVTYPIPQRQIDLANGKLVQNR